MAAYWLVIFGCAGGEPPEDTDVEVEDTDVELDDCGFTGSTSGAVALTLDYGDDDGCAGSGYDDRLALSLGVNTDYIVYVEIAGGAVAGETATGLVAAVEVADVSVGYDGWRTPDDGCTVDITEARTDEFFDWVVSGSGSCSAVATGDDVEGELTIGEFTFTSVASWAE